MLEGSLYGLYPPKRNYLDFPAVCRQDGTLVTHPGKGSEMLKLTSVVGFLSILLIFSVALPLPSQGDSGSSRDSLWGYQALYAWVHYIETQVKDERGHTYNQQCLGPKCPNLEKPRDAPKQFKKAVAAYFWGLPLVEMRRTQQAILDKYGLAPNDLYNSDLRNTGDSIERGGPRASWRTGN